MSPVVGTRSAAIQHSLRVFSQRRVNALDVRQQAPIDLADEPAQASGIDMKIAGGGSDVSAELPHGRANLLPMVIEAFEWGELVVGRRNQRLNVIRAAITEDPVE